MALPRYVVLQSNYNHKYLHCVKKNKMKEGVQPFLQFSGEEVVSPYAKYQVEMAKNGEGLVHIRSCCNNKYWARCSPDYEWIDAAAKEPEEDQSKWSCTLFKPIFLHGGGGEAKKEIRFFHVQLGQYVCLWLVPPQNDCLFAGSKEPANEPLDVYTIIDWESLLILPKHVAFKGNNDCYLSARMTDGNPYLQFASNDIGDETVGHEIFTTHNGSIRIKSNNLGKFWRSSPNGICADADDTSSDNSDTLFWPIKVDDNVIALRNLGNNNFCKSLTSKGEINCLNAAVSTISKEERLQVEELIISRNIYNVNFRLEDLRIYNKSVMTMATVDAVNRTQQTNNEELKLSYANTRSSTWNASVSIKMGAKLTSEVGIPLIVDGKIEFSGEINVGFQYGKTESFTNVVETVYKVIVPPRSIVKVRLVATKGSCDVPFSYTQCDTLTNGDRITHRMDDGVYTGDNCFNFKYETDHEYLENSYIL